MTLNPAALISDALEDELRQKVRAHGIVVWLDVDGAYTAFVDARSGQDTPRFLGYRGSFLELMLALEPLCAGGQKPGVVVHVPNISADVLTRTPLLEVMKAGTRFERRLDTLVTQVASGRVHPDALAALLAQKPSLAEADAWLAQHIAESAAGIRAQLVSLSPSALLDELIARGPLAARVNDPIEAQAVLDQAAVWLGLSDAWREATFDAQAPRAEALVFTIASFALAVEYVFDLRRPPYEARLVPLGALVAPLRDACRGLCVHLRARHPELYQRIADQTESQLPDEVDKAAATDLGNIDTFRFEEDKVLVYALEALEFASCAEAEALSKKRAESDVALSIWTRRPDRRAAWLVVRDVARLGVAIEQAPAPDPERVTSLDALMDAYVAHGAAVDRAHRVLEQRRVTTLFPELPYFETLRRRADTMRGAWALWADGWARVMAEVCRRHGFLPSPRRQQRTLFDEVVMGHVRALQASPRKTPGDLPTVLFVVDALRFEMAQALFAEMAQVPHTEATLEARAAELPTLTAVGMNAIAPTATQTGSGATLRPILVEAGQRIQIQGFSTGAFKVDDRASRWRAMFDRAGGECVERSLDQVVNEDAAALKRRVARARLVVVHSLELDDAGESGVGPMAFDPILQKLRAAWRLLRDADVRRFVVTSDHGFLILDGLVRPAEAQGRKTDPDRRHQLTRNAAVDSGRVRVPLAQLGYVEADGVFLVMSETTNVFDRGQRQTSFVHGGNSLQERVVPVISVVHRSASGASSGRYVIVARKDDGVGGMHRVSGEVRLAEDHQLSLSFAQAKDADVALRVVGDAGVVEIVYAGGGATSVAASTVRAEVGRRFEVFFRIAGAKAERVQVELAHVGALDVEPAVLGEYFEASVAAVASASTSVAAATAPGPWLDQVASEFRGVYERLARHGVIDEVEVVAELGGARAARRFSSTIDAEREKLPFGVRVEQGPSGKRWVREGGQR